MQYVPIDYHYPSSFGCEQKEPHPRKKDVQEIRPGAFIRLMAPGVWVVFDGHRTITQADEPGRAWHAAYNKLTLHGTGETKPKRLRAGFGAPASMVLKRAPEPKPNLVIEISETSIEQRPFHTGAL